MQCLPKVQRLEITVTGAYPPNSEAGLFSLRPNVDRAYLDQRIRTETVGNYGIEDLKS
jgi:hypothetical protein